MSILICSWQFLTLLAVMVAVSFWGFFANHDCRETERYRERHRKNSKFRDLELQMGLKTVLCCHWGASGFEGDVHGWGGQIIIIKSPGRATSEEAPNSWEILTLEVLLVIVLLQLLLQLYCKAGWEGSHLFPSNSIWHPTGNFEGSTYTSHLAPVVESYWARMWNKDIDNDKVSCVINICLNFSFNIVWVSMIPHRN